ncbi:TetR/AcrR family transcriptional regulator [Jidongwangia harbinensis]|uniref:TetR/AcrR family transcriptional regulator n=1 Tax=Jidongwangia harbinensis TaxID=2878561 RepID=UPI001CDA2C17|nr:TetR/AcrR family transcriptional regulator [Jidongwangia harbinensis]MCA2216573.1 TetR/AcrR family transcriptional regulator [Jidongwangia harbinensis]
MTGTSTRDRIVEAAAALLTQGGREAVSTRAVCAAAQVQAPAIYRFFGDKQGLLDAVARYGLEAYLSDKKSLEQTADPVNDLRRGWDLHIGFGLAQPAFYTLIYGDPRPGADSPAAAEASAILAALVRRVAQAGRLRVNEERAVQLVHSAGRGLTLTLIGMPPDRRDPELSTIARESVLATVTTGVPESGADTGPVSAAVALRATLPEATVLTANERALLADWLERIATAGTPVPASSGAGTRAAARGRPAVS